LRYEIQVYEYYGFLPIIARIPNYNPKYNNIRIASNADSEEGLTLESGYEQVASML